MIIHLIEHYAEHKLYRYSCCDGLWRKDSLSFHLLQIVILINISDDGNIIDNKNLVIKKILVMMKMSNMTTSSKFFYYFLHSISVGYIETSDSDIKLVLRKRCGATFFYLAHSSPWHLEFRR